MKDSGNIALKTFGGDGIKSTAEKAAKMAITTNKVVEFDFNGIQCLVDKSTNPDWLVRDYMNAHMMKWETIGPNCQQEYTPEIEKQIKEARQEIKERHEKQAKEYKAKSDKARADFDAKVAGIEMEFSENGLEGWNKGREANQDPYGSGIFDFAESWAKLMQLEMSNGKTLVECASETSHQLDFMGITGYMYGAAVSTLSQVWKHGEALRKWHNKDYGVPESKGVVNPAIITI